MVQPAIQLCYHGCCPPITSYSTLKDDYYLQNSYSLILNSRRPNDFVVYYSLNLGSLRPSLAKIDYMECFWHECDVQKKNTNTHTHLDDNLFNFASIERRQ